MKFEKVFKTILLPTAMISMISSCGDDFDFESHYPGGDIKKEYADNWEKEYGKIDPNQTWNMCKQYSVTVNTHETSSIQIYAKMNGVYKIVANYSEISGTQTLNFDGIEGIEEVYVSNGHTAKYAKLGEIVDFGIGTRGSVIKRTGPGLPMVSLGNKTFEFKYKDFILPEINPGVSKGGAILGNGSSGDFTVVATTGTIVLYPVFFQQSSNRRVGIYLDGDKTKSYDIYSTDGTQFSPLGWRVNETSTFTSFDGSGGSYTVPSSADKEKLEYQSNSIVITVEPGTVIGFYAYKVNGKAIHYYSEKKHNSNNATRVRTIYDATYDKTLIGLYSESSDERDFVFAVENVITLDKTKTSWTIACEDLGSTDMSDNDFNDLVFKVEHTSGETTAKVTPLAAGGTLKAEFTMGTVNNWYEIHKCFGSDYENPDSEGKYKMINTKSKDGINNKIANEITFTVPTSLSMAGQSMGGMAIKVYKEGSILGTAIDITAPEQGRAPHMLLLPENWRWPVEKEPIHVAYIGFDKWNSNSSVFDWVTNIRDSNILY